MERLGPYTYEPAPGDSITSDTLLLAEFAPLLSPSDALLDIGAGSGALPILLAAKNPKTRITGVEIQALRAEAARKNIERNGLGARITIHHMDYRDLPQTLPHGSFTHIITNPPYIKKGCGRPSSRKDRQIARHEVMGTIKDLLRTASIMLAPAGRLYIVFTTERLHELRTEASKNGLLVLREKPVRAKNNAPLRRVLIEAKKGGKSKERGRKKEKEEGGLCPPEEEKRRGGGGLRQPKE